MATPTIGISHVVAQDAAPGKAPSAERLRLGRIVAALGDLLGGGDDIVKFDDVLVSGSVGEGNDLWNKAIGLEYTDVLEQSRLGQPCDQSTGQSAVCF